MSIFTPGRRWQPAYSPFKKEPFGRRLLANTEYVIKSPLFGCRMCGNCLLQETAFICPMECPKGLRNGPCGGSTSEYCYVDKTRPCIWYKIYERSFRMNRQEKLLEVLPPLDWEKTGTETWGDVSGQVQKLGTAKVARELVFGTPAQRRELGKDPCGVVNIRARRDASSIVLQVSDDGRGIDRRRVLEVAQARGLVAANEVPRDDEILRLIDALQTTDKHGVATPANWRPGDKVILPPPKTIEGAAERLKAGYECTDWFFCKKELPKDG